MNNPAHASSSTLPTVTLAIPARNEDAILESVLHQHLTSTYPKLEIIVVDDCSHDKTAEIIKSFAHRGVRFIQGKSTAESWLGKNYAYQELLKSASGELILFCGADIKFSQNTISELVERYLKSNIKMLAVLPKYEPTASDNRFWDVAMQATRYFWQLGLTGLLSSTPPVVGSCWLVEREALMEIGGFKSFRQAIEPERQITKQLAGSRYLFLPANSFESEVVSTKRSDQQKNHILRVAYPLLKRSPMLVGLTAIATVAFLAIPFASFISLFFYEQVDTVWLISAGSGLLLILTYSLIYWYISPRYLLSVVLMLPFMLIQFPVALINSMISYEFSEVEWKGRNICLPPINLQLKRPIKKRGRRRRFRN